MEIILLLSLFNPSCNKGVWLNKTQPQGSYVLVLMGPYFSKVTTMKWHLNLGFKHDWGTPFGTLKIES
jgi:hypothetical protein